MGLAWKSSGSSALWLRLLFRWQSLANRRTLPASRERRGSVAGWECRSAFFAGYLALPRSWAALAPDQAWQWLPYLGIAAAVAVQHAFTRIGCGGWLRCVWPCWPAVFSRRTGPSSAFRGRGRSSSRLLYSWLIAALLEALPGRAHCWTPLHACCIRGTLSAVAIGAEVRIEVAQLAAIAAGGGWQLCWLG